jgi:hypothetical protein
MKASSTQPTVDDFQRALKLYLEYLKRPGGTQAWEALI